MGSKAQEEYAAFEEKVKRTVYIDNLSPQVTEAVLKSALNQFGIVLRVTFVPNYLEPQNISRCALVEMKEAKHAKAVVSEIAQFPFMVSGMPRPVRARPAEIEMFDDRPRRPGRKIHCRWLEPGDPDFEVARKLKRLTRKHAAEASFLLQQQLKREEKLHKQQLETLKANYNKYEMVDGIFADNSVQRLADHYRMRISYD
ncbi:hypothetical protein JCGZ_20842 [Jatropha curcas]|uniref:RRM domain-containing protein n=1 Tax=Jatropha curcas TaxID=180498 RepID=A0A067L601_JATCU|nr:paraspeckle component 1 [Jatropha curcas]XP_020532687.1 paraspeckle component 1 [Jatropha curcas]KDP43832.1 hypothetical protein JCGZ_20842 [Jatropha curcas]